MDDPRTALAQPKTAKGQATRARIVDAAAGLIFEAGVARTSLDDVGAVARVGKSQLYHYFRDKSELVGEVITRQTDQVIASQDPFLAEIGNWDALTAWRDHVVLNEHQLGCAGGCPLGSLAGELADSDLGARESVAAGFDRWSSAFAQSLARMQHAGLLSADADPEQLGIFLLAALQGGLLLCKSYRSTRPLEIALDAAIAHLRSFEVVPPDGGARRLS